MISNKQLMVSPESPSAEIESDYEILFEFWQDLPLIKVIEPEVFAKMSDHPIRSGIIHCLRHGIEDNGRYRYAMSLKELREPVEEFVHKMTKQDQEIKLTALYHHRDKLLEEDLIKEVGTFLEGKRYTTYYGRTARAFIGDHTSKEKVSQQTELLKSLILELNPQLNSEQVDVVLQTMAKQTKITHNKIEQWVENHVGVINKLDIDTIKLYSMLASLDKSTPEVEDARDQIRSYLEF